MNTQTISVDFPADIFLTLNETEKELEREIKLMFAVSLYNRQKITVGKAAGIAGLTRLEFEAFLSANKIPISRLTIEDVISDSKKIIKRTEAVNR